MLYRVLRCYRRKSFPGFSPRTQYATMKLTTKTIEAMQPTDRRLEIKDDQCRGLYLLIQPSGPKGWSVRYFLDSKVRKATLGSFPKMSLAEARIAAGKIFEQLADNVDPREADADLRGARSPVHRRLPASTLGREHRAGAQAGDCGMGGPADRRHPPAR